MPAFFIFIIFFFSLIPEKGFIMCIWKLTIFVFIQAWVVSFFKNFFFTSSWLVEKDPSWYFLSPLLFTLSQNRLWCLFIQMNGIEVGIVWLHLFRYKCTFFCPSAGRATQAQARAGRACYHAQHGSPEGTGSNTWPQQVFIFTVTQFSYIILMVVEMYIKKFSISCKHHSKCIW